MMVGSSRNASYSKNPQMKDGSLRALIYNDAKHRGKQHLLRDEFNPNRLGKPEVPASWVSALRVAPLAIFESEIYGSWSTQRWI